MLARKQRQREDYFPEYIYYYAKQKSIEAYNESRKTKLKAEGIAES
jgi:hypothetical protein